ncbi:B- and T-lymphocyte attenuator [Scomber scombrus]|uniref:B- and T-lymphocyte attenuator n=1 Tax=Scomber scombrus TaxID=13677 RepID=UPI002DDAB628|nr:B- and T-lymphocyte attenuator [Scomber scombrus]
MNMSRSLDRFLYASVLIFYCFKFVSIYGKPQNLISSCETKLMVQRGMGWKAAPWQNLTVSCTVKLCGESLNVSWCKLTDTIHCQRINNRRNVEITQTDNDVKELTSFLTFKWISTRDDGLYRCDLKEYKYELISHTINISVSDIYHGVESSDNGADDKSQSVVYDVDKATSWLPYFVIVISISFLVLSLTAITFSCFYAWKRILTNNPTKAQEISIHTLPEDSKGSVPSTSAMHHSPTNAGTPPSLMTNGNQPTVAHTADNSQVSDHAVYAAINHKQSRMPAREQRTSTKHDNPEYASINVS